MTPNSSCDGSTELTVFPVEADGGLLQPPTPTLPLGAGGPRERAAGWVFPAAAAATARVHECDELLRLHAAAAAADLGFVVAGGGRADDPRSPAAVHFVGLDDAGSCPRCRRRDDSAGRGRRTPALTVGYAAGPPELAAAHRLHACCDVVLLLRAAGGRPRFVYPPPGTLADAGLSSREADVLVLLLAGETDSEVAARLFISAATARAHARAVLRKLGAADRRALRARLLGRTQLAGG